MDNWNQNLLTTLSTDAHPWQSFPQKLCGWEGISGVHVKGKLEENA